MLVTLTTKLDDSTNWVYCIILDNPCGGRMACKLDSASSGLGSSPGQGHFVVFLVKTFYSLSTLEYKWVLVNYCLGHLTECWEVRSAMD